MNLINLTRLNLFSKEGNNLFYWSLKLTLRIDKSLREDYLIISPREINKEKI